MITREPTTIMMTITLNTEMISMNLMHCLKNIIEGIGSFFVMFVVLLRIYIHIEQVEKLCLTQVGIEPTTFAMLAQCSVK